MHTYENIPNLFIQKSIKVKTIKMSINGRDTLLYSQSMKYHTAIKIANNRYTHQHGGISDRIHCVSAVVQSSRTEKLRAQR